MMKVKIENLKDVSPELMEDLQVPCLAHNIYLIAL